MRESVSENIQFKQYYSFSSSSFVRFGQRFKTEILVLSKFEFVFEAAVKFSIIRDIESTVCIVAVYFLS